MSALAEQLANTIADALEASPGPKNGEQWPIDFTPEPMFVPSFTVDELQTLRLTVAPTGRTLSRETRTSTRQVLTIEIAVQQHTNDKARVTQLCQLVDALVDWLADAPASGCPVLPLELSQPTFYSPEHWRQHQVFTSVIRFDVAAR